MKDSENEMSIWKNAVTIPNIMSAFRLLLIPVIIWVYTVKDDRMLTLALLILSGLTDVADGYVARHFNMVSDLGKILDPLADKLTQAAALMCLMMKFREIVPLFVMLAVKELTLGLFGLYVVRRTGCVKSANWHGKLTTFLLYLTIGIHMVFPNAAASISSTMIILSGSAMLLSFTLYIVRNIEQLNEPQGEAIPKHNRA